MRKHRERPGLPPIIRAEVTGRHFSLRVILLACTATLALLGLGYGLFSLLNGDPGWQTVEYVGNEKNVSEEFILRYDYGSSGASASVERKMVSDLFSDLMEQGYLAFSIEEHSDSCHNLAYLNDHLNQPVSLDPMLYEALTQLKAHESRYAYLAPAYGEYQRLMHAESQGEAAVYDPGQNPELSAYLLELSAFANDPAHIDVELLGQGQAVVHVSDAYLQYAAENELETLVDVGWLRNAFLTDYVADRMAEQGLVRGYLVSYDGFTRNLDASGRAYNQNVFDRLGRELNLPAVLSYEGPMSLVSLRNYPMGAQDRWHYYAMPEEYITVFLDPADGRSKSSTDNLLCYSQSKSCTEILLEAAPLFIAEELDEAALSHLAEREIFSVWGVGTTLRYTQPGAKLALTEEMAQTYVLEQYG